MAALRGQMSTVLETLASTLQASPFSVVVWRKERPGKTESEVHAAVAGQGGLGYVVISGVRPSLSLWIAAPRLSALCETTLKHCQETAGEGSVRTLKRGEERRWRSRPNSGSCRRTEFRFESFGASSTRWWIC